MRLNKPGYKGYLLLQNLKVKDRTRVASGAGTFRSRCEQKTGGTARGPGGSEHGTDGKVSRDGWVGQQVKGPQDKGQPGAVRTELILLLLLKENKL